MSIQETHLDVNDYLDLYLYAGNIGDQLWQHEIIEKLQNVPNEKFLKNQSFVIDNLWEKFEHVNEEILTLYHQLRNHSSNGDVQEKIWILKQQRISLGRQIRLAKKEISLNYVNEK